ncbi:acyl-CoA dehydrogenase [Actinomadura sp. NTSP31]|uniref:acyl-CoA dehydrogenase n=1 Tax=Actinomadura sp. NTSP31 TaxID=1735447 RepID=UPI0035C0ADDE
MTARDRVRTLTAMLGDPWDEDNPTGYAQVLNADERAETLAAGERVLDRFALNAELVPSAAGGRFERLDDLVELMRVVFRRDPCLAVGYGVSSFLASVNVWAAGDERQRGWFADFLLDNRKAACAYHELAHGNDLAAAEFEAALTGDRLMLNGRKEVVANVRRAEAMVVFARTDPGGGNRGFSQLLVDRSALDRGRIVDLPRYGTVGLRGVQLGGIEFRDCPLGVDSVIGRTGSGVRTALTSFQVTRVALPGMATAILDSALGAALRHLRRRMLYGRTAADLPYQRRVLVDAFADLLMCEIVTMAGARAVHALPGSAGVYAAAVKYGTTRTLMAAVNQLSVALGSYFYLREGESGIFQKLLRDLQPLGVLHASSAACQLTILPQLPRMAQRSWTSPPTVPGELFASGGELPPLSFDALRISGSGQDPVLPLAGLDPGIPEIRRDVEALTDELRALTADCAGLPTTELSVAASSETYDLTTRYVRLLMLACCQGFWHEHRDDGTFLGDPAWLIAVVTRLTASELPPAVEQRLFAELLRRADEDLGLGLHPTGPKE